MLVHQPLHRRRIEQPLAAQPIRRLPIQQFRPEPLAAAENTSIMQREVNGSDSGENNDIPGMG
jgi:hypothetical protein